MGFFVDWEGRGGVRLVRVFCWWLVCVFFWVRVLDGVLYL